jgi:hypothetical protein
MESDLPRTPARTVVGVVLGVVAAVALLIGALAFALYGYCEDSCDKPPRTFSGALGEALPFLLVAVVLMTIACFLFMRRRRSGVRRWVAAAALAVLSSAGFVGGLWLLAGLVGASDDSGAVLLLGLLVLVALWLWLTVAAARRAERH